MGSGASLNNINEKIVNLNISEDLVANVREECLLLYEMGFQASEVEDIIRTHYKDTAEISVSTVESPYDLKASAYNSQHQNNIETVASTSDKTLVLLPSSYKVTPNDKLYKNIQAKVDTFAKVNTVDTYNQNEIRKAATKGKSKPRRASDVGMPAQQDLLKGALKNMKYSERDLHGLNSESSILPHEDKPDLTYFCGNFLNSQRKHLG